MIKLYNDDRLPMPRCVMLGPKWRKWFTQRVTLAEWIPSITVGRDRKLNVFTFEDEVRERIQETIRPGVFADWSDPRERLPLKTR